MTEIKINSKEDDPLLKQLKDSNVEVQGIKSQKTFSFFHSYFLIKAYFKASSESEGSGKLS